jgi:hypothetical protein
MAGYAMGFDDGGNYEPGGENYPGEDESGALPVVDSDEQQVQQQDNSGALPVAKDQQQPQEPQSRSGLDFNAAHVPGNAKRIIQYLMGGDAAPPQVAQKFEQGVKVEHPGISDDDAALVAVHKALEHGGPEAAWAMTQYNRSAYNAKQAFALAALTGSANGKPSDPSAAAQAATQASPHMLDGSQARFAAAPNGSITATVTMPGGHSVNYNLSPQQFAQYLNVGGDGQWDKVREQGGIPGTLQKIVSGAALQKAQVNGAQPASQAQQDDDRGTQPSSVPGQKFGSTPSTTDLSGGEPSSNYGQWNKMASPDYDPQDVARAQRMFPNDRAAQSKWLTEQESQEAERQVKRDVAEGQERARLGAARERAGGQVGAAQARAKGTVDAATVRAESYAKSQQQKAQLALQKMAQQANDANARNRINIATRLINNPNWATQSKEERNAILKQYGLDNLMEPTAPASQPAAQTPPAAAPAQAPQRPANVPQGAKFYKGKWYTRGPNGEAVPVQ